VLRRLLLGDGDYGRSWHDLGLPGAPTIEATDLDAMLGTADRDVIRFAFAPPGPTARQALPAGDLDIGFGTVTADQVGDLCFAVLGYSRGFGPIAVAIPKAKVPKIFADPNKEAERSFHAALGQRTTRSMSVGALLRSPALLVSGTLLSRDDVIAYVANKRGGVHFDAKRGGARGPALALMDQELASYMVAGKPAITLVFMELLSIAEALIESNDARRFCEEYARVGAAAAS
jgi:hypothetical protein